MAAGARRTLRRERRAQALRPTRDHDDTFEGSPVPPDPREQDEKERYMRRQLWWALIGLVLFALVMLFGWGGAAAADRPRDDATPIAPSAVTARR
jgi:hypothetical protein